MLRIKIFDYEKGDPMGLTIPLATPVELIRVGKKPEDWLEAKLYTVEGKSGVWHKISRDRRTGVTTTVENAVVAQEGEDLVELVQWVELAEWIIQTYPQVGVAILAHEKKKDQLGELNAVIYRTEDDRKNAEIDKAAKAAAQLAENYIKADGMLCTNPPDPRALPPLTDETLQAANKRLEEATAAARKRVEEQAKWPGAASVGSGPVETVG